MNIDINKNSKNESNQNKSLYRENGDNFNSEIREIQNL